MPDERMEHHQVRLAAARDEDTVRGLVFNALFAVLREAGGEAAARAADPTGKGSRVDFFTYPAADFLRLSWDAAERLGPSAGGADQVFFRVGHKAGSAVLESMLGKTILAVSGAGGVRQLLASVPSAYRGTVSYGERRVQVQDEGRARAVFRGELLAAPFHCGVFTAVLERAGARNVRAEVREAGALEAELLLSWE